MPSLLLPWDAIDDVLFDMDGTLLDLAFDNHFWQQLLPERYAETRGISLSAGREALLPHFTATRGSLDWYCLDFWTRLTGLNVAALKREVAANVRLLPETIEVLDALQTQGKRLWLVTNAHPDALAVKLERAPIGGYFSRTVSAHHLRAPKEQPGFWHALQALHPFDPQRSMFIDDSLPVLEAARNYGVAHTVAARWPDRSQPPRSIEDFPGVERLTELLPVATTTSESA